METSRRCARLAAATRSDPNRISATRTRECATVDRGWRDSTATPAKIFITDFQKRDVNVSMLESH